MGTCRGQKPSLSLVVAGGGLEVCYSPVCARFGIFCLENPFMSRFFTSVTAIVFPYYLAKRVRSFLFMCVIQYNSVIPYGYMYVNASYSRLSGCLLHLCHEHRCPVGMEAWGLVGDKSRAFHSWWQEGVSRSVFTPVCARFGIFCFENSLRSRFFMSVTDIVLPYYAARARSFLFMCVIV